MKTKKQNKTITACYRRGKWSEGDPKSGASTSSATDAASISDGNKQKPKKLGLGKTWETGSDGPIAQDIRTETDALIATMYVLVERIRRVEAWIESQGGWQKTSKQNSKLVSRKGVSRRGNRV